MRLVRGLIKRHLGFIQGKQWYHQRFDGAPHFIFLISMAELMPEARKYGCHATSHFGLFEQDKSDWYIDQADIDRIAKRVVELGMKYPHFTKKLMKKWSADEAAFYRLCDTTDWNGLKKLSDIELNNIYDEYIRRDVKFVTSSSIIDGFALGTDFLIQKELMMLLKSKGLEKQLSRYFSVLTAPVHHSFINEAEVALLRVAFRIEKIPALARSFRKLPIKQLQKTVRKYPIILKMLEKQEHEYFWSKNNYVHNNYLDVNTWVGELKAVFKSTINIARQINQIEDTPQRSFREKRLLIKTLNPPKKIRVLLEISEDFTYWQDNRKKMTYWSTHYGSILLKEIGRRFGFTLHEMKYLAPPEVDSLFTKKPFVTSREARARWRKCLWLQMGQEKYEVITSDARGTYKKIFEKKSLQAVNDFRGLSANRGVARGPAKIVKSATETKKVKSGDVLVAVMTRPDYIMGMKKAAAIVTNEGGVTCHAAIVARELNIPCVIGTKIATDVLHDGDIVEVNGNHGVVTVIERKK
ncbi:MAG: PEP-utilizing enzyme [Patescibacteria group bacterium]